ncbi:Acylpyruvase FAHD1, mitochondrial [Armadillidium nasatum]|uniref:Oxaloacetate tautomerase FAHD1, mitochondrial n=1 Tax=Armadillidium nasatum TaxID=96803 RepID=A0A5N5TCV3_9CRUS|nr:Acylpyruvase FAHD1, mitochondrial [Armadillidium nasatum]
MSVSKNLQNFTQWGRKIVAVGRNYRDHCAELGNPIPKSPLLFMKPPSSYLIEEAGPILIPRGCNDIHHEVELGVVIGSKCQDVSEKEVLNHVAGYALTLDMTARDFQNEAKAKGNPWAMAKCFDTALPVSRFIALNEIPDPGNVELWCKVNGEERQRGTTSDMIFSISHLISYISKYFTLDEGDLVLTGTPAGVGPVKEGDVLSCGITDLIEMNFNVKRKL